MREPTEHLSSLIEILNFKSKKDLDRHCRNIVVYQQDLFWLILAAQHGVFHPYKYANHFERNVSQNIYPNELEQQAIRENGTGEFTTKLATKFSTKIFQMFREQRALAAHLFYTPDHRYWHLFYFDNRDTSDVKNHWKHGSHIHYVSDLWPEITMSTVWQQVTNGQLYFPNKMHIRYKKR